jgi:hypothetical protein
MVRIGTRPPDVHTPIPCHRRLDLVNESGSHKAIQSITTGFRRFARCRKHLANATLQSVKHLPGVALGKEPPTKSQSAKISLLGVFYRAPGKGFAECKPGTRQRKVAVTVPAPSVLGLPGVMLEAPGKKILIFFQNFFAGCL